LAAQREEAAASLKRFCPKWSGKSFPTWRRYPRLPDDAPEQAANLLFVVMFLDAVLSQPALWEDFKHWHRTLAALQSWEAKRPLIAAGMRMLVDRPKKMRAARANQAAERRSENRRRAEAALAATDGDTAAAAKRVGKSVRQFNRWLRVE
jgi:hypothetical protein